MLHFYPLFAILAASILVKAHVEGIESPEWKKMKKNKRKSDTDEEIQPMSELDNPQNEDPHRKIMFWRPQKVGSSTLVNILNTYSFRHELTVSPKGAKNSFCHFLLKCAEELEFVKPGASTSRKYKLKRIDHRRVTRTADVSLQHQICHMDGTVTQKALPCAFRTSDDASVPIKQVTMVREPVSRAISVYYFWGELFKLKAISLLEKKEKKGPKTKSAIGQAQSLNSTLSLGKFDYHGDETTPPPAEVARDFVSDFSKVYTRGMPGPSLSWSSYSHSALDASSRLLPSPSLASSWPQVLPLVLERLDESLVLMCDYLGWSLADAVFIKPRKHLSSHPKAASWDQTAITELGRKLGASGEVFFYDKAMEALDIQIRLVNERARSNVSDDGPTLFETRTALFRLLKSRAAEVCRVESPVVEMYRAFLSSHERVRRCPTLNKLRDVDESFIEQGHCFILSPESKLFSLSIDICGSCEAQAMVYAVENGLASTVRDAPLYQDLKASLSDEVREKLFTNCP